MKNNNKRKAASDLKKKRKREAHKSNEQALAIKRESRKRFPGFEFGNDPKHVDTDSFEHVVRSILKTFDYEKSELVSSNDKNIFKLIKKLGVNDVVNKLSEGSQDSRLRLLSHYSFYVGSWVYDQLKAMDLSKKFLPFNDCQFILGKNYSVKFRSLKSAKTTWGRAYYSSKEPKVIFDSKEYTVSFSRHALERIAQRCVYDWLSYRGAGDIFAYINDCIYYEPCLIYKSGKPFPGFTFYDLCTPGFFNYNYVANLIQEPKPRLNYYHRVGYCPVGLSGKFAHAITLLTPGMRGTPEYVILNQIADVVEKSELLKLVKDTVSFKDLAKNNGFNSIKWFHEHGIPQVIASEKELYRHD